jgi:type I restriction enzyme R subunit
VVDREGAAKPFLLSIGERAEDLAAHYEDRQLTTQQVLAAFEQLAQEYIESDAERQRLGLDANAFAIYRILRPLTGDEAAPQAQAINVLFAGYPDYRWHGSQEGQLRTALYKALRPMVGAGKMIATANALLRLQRV